MKTAKELKLLEAAIQTYELTNDSNFGKDGFVKTIKEAVEWVNNYSITLSKKEKSILLKFDYIEMQIESILTILTNKNY